MPEASFDTDNEGQIIISTNIAYTEDGLLDISDFDDDGWVKNPESIKVYPRI